MLKKEEDPNGGRDPAKIVLLVRVSGLRVSERKYCLVVSKRHRLWPCRGDVRACGRDN